MKAETENRLVVEIAKGLQSVRVKYDTSVDPVTLSWTAAIEKWLPEDVVRKCARFCGGSGFKTFISNEISRKLLGANKFNAKADKKKLTDTSDFRDTISAAQEITKVLAGLPYRYRVSLGLPLSFSTLVRETVDEYPLSDSLLICSVDRLPKPFPLTSDNEHFASTLWDDFWGPDGHEQELNRDRLYLTSTTLGYSGTAGTSLLAREFEDGLRAFYGAGLALGVLSYEYIKEGDEPPIIIHREDAPGRLAVAFKGLEDDLWSNKEHLSTKKLIGGKPSLDVNVTLSRISQIFKDETTAKRLFTACIWYFRAKFSQRPLDKLLEATIAIEVVLGDRDTADGIGLTKLLGNRCAYMLGKTSAEREGIQATFTELYKLRSSIVHSGKHRADQKEAGVVNEATALCGRIIAHELIGLTNESIKRAL